MLLVLAACGCQPDRPNPASASSNSITQAQPRLPTVTLWVGSAELITEVARSPVQLQTGMMFRQSMEENEAMLFVFPYPHQASFYMRNTSIPLSCAYLDAEGTILEIHDLHPFNETPVESTATNIRFVVETRQGWFERHQIQPGAVFRTSQGSLPEVLLRRP
ncbi:MAG TPA: DUF192 domain-containing protein [Candidatus Paceibacterota bacterium]|nr:DUF192 domain-containing protein [Candidatus Paceibacterota bacterium]